MVSFLMRQRDNEQFLKIDCSGYTEMKYLFLNKFFPKGS